MLKIVLDGRGLTLTVQLLGRIAGRCGFCTETFALLTLGILALEEAKEVLQQANRRARSICF